MATKDYSPPPKKVRKKYITPLQFLKLPLSQAIFQVIEDVKVMRTSHIKIDLSSWWNIEEGTEEGNAQTCSVCLGGAALYSFAPETVNMHTLQLSMFARKVLKITSSDGYRIAGTFDSLRQGSPSEAWTQWYSTDVPYRLRPHNEWQEMGRTAFHGELDNQEIRQLLTKLRKFAKFLEKEGY